jgi:3-hydroxybutyryl-CoA dehydratase
MGDRYLEDFAVGATFVTNARTITEADIVQFACLTGDFHPVHTNAEFAEASIFEQRVVHGLLVYVTPWV